MKDDDFAEEMDSFERSFRDGVSGCRGDCACGREFYNPGDGGEWTWEDGEVETLAASNATSLPWAVSYITFEGATYVIDCDCWKNRARRLIAWMLGHDDKIAKFLTEEKQRKTRAAEHSPIVA